MNVVCSSNFVQRLANVFPDAAQAANCLELTKRTLEQESNFDSARYSKVAAFFDGTMQLILELPGMALGSIVAIVFAIDLKNSRIELRGIILIHAPEHLGFGVCLLDSVDDRDL